MAQPPTREDVAALAKQAGLDLSDAHFEQLVGAYANVRRMIDAIPHNRPRGDEPAHVFVPAKFLPEAD
jgi:Asp-tRNA(Asn)/Glu-tRNA(Gln) amidotransferase C subunit